nr:uncharacterized ATP-dependent helicase C29A10.10c isoform X1 [Tanacetum cinerariifolium]
MHSMGKTIAELHAMLKLHEKGILKKAETLVVLAYGGFTRIPQASDRYNFYVDVEESESGNLNKPPNYKAALSYPKSDKWLESMNMKRQSMKDNQVWVLVELPSNGQTVGSKWLFKKKNNMDGKVMGNASTLVQSDDWAALIADAKTRECFTDMESLPKDFLVSKVPPPPTYGPPQSRFSNMRGLKRPGLRHRPYDHMESRSGTPSEDDEKTNSSFAARNGNYRSFKPPYESSLDDFDQSSDRSRDAWQHGASGHDKSTKACSHHGFLSIHVEALGSSIVKPT